MSNPSPLKLGFIGLGIMGAPMCANLIKAGHQLFVHTRGKVPEAIADSSATQCTTARGVAQRADIIFVISYTIILAVKTEFGPQPQWYQWWYMFHYLSASAAFLLSTLALGIQTPLMFLFVVAVACLIIDCVLMGYLAGLVTAGEISIQAFFIAIDLLYLVFFFMTTVNAEQTSFALLVHMARSGTYARLTRQKHTD